MDSFLCWLQGDFCDIPAVEKDTCASSCFCLQLHIKYRVLFSTNKYSIKSMDVKEVKNNWKDLREGKEYNKKFSIKNIDKTD